MRLGVVSAIAIAGLTMSYAVSQGFAQDLGGVAGGVGDVAEAAAGAATDTVGAAVDAVGSTAGTAGAAAGSVSGTAQETAGSVAGAATDAVGSSIEAAGSALGAAPESAGPSAGSSGAAAGGTGRADTSPATGGAGTSGPAAGSRGARRVGSPSPVATTSSAAVPARNGVATAGRTLGTVDPRASGLPAQLTPVAFNRPLPRQAAPVSTALPAVLVPSSAGGRDNERVGVGFVAAPGLAALSRTVASLPSVPGLPQNVVEACRLNIQNAARPYAAQRVEAASAGPARRFGSGGYAAPVLVRITYSRQGGFEVRQAYVSCEFDARPVVAATATRRKGTGSNIAVASAQGGPGARPAPQSRVAAARVGIRSPSLVAQRAASRKVVLASTSRANAYRVRAGVVGRLQERGGPSPKPAPADRPSKPALRPSTGRTPSAAPR